MTFQTIGEGIQLSLILDALGLQVGPNADDKPHGRTASITFQVAHTLDT
jgi:hypothetical protein